MPIVQRKGTDKTLQNSPITTSPNSPALNLTLYEQLFLIALNSSGYTSFFNDCISYVLRALLISELAYNNCITLHNNCVKASVGIPADSIQAQVMQLIKQNDCKYSVQAWIDFLSGETWNVFKLNFQLKQLRERIAKQLVDKGVLGNEKKNFVLVDMNTHPIVDLETSEQVYYLVIKRLLGDVAEQCNFRTAVKNISSENVDLLCLGCLYGNVMDRVSERVPLEMRGKLYGKAEGLLLNTIKGGVVGQIVACLGRMDSIL